MSSKEIKITIPLVDLNLILACLGKQPYENVFLLIDSLQKQAKFQLGQSEEKNE